MSGKVLMYINKPILVGDLIALLGAETAWDYFLDTDDAENIVVRES